MIQTFLSNDTTYSIHDKIGDGGRIYGLPIQARHGISTSRIFGVFFFLRLVGITNAALWFGTAVFFAAFVWPSFDSPEMGKILPPSHSGAAAHVVLGRYLALQSWCGAIALAHLLVEWLYAGRALRRWTLYLVLGLLAIALAEGLMVQPRLKGLHLEIYGIRSTPQQREQARRSARFWHGALEASNVFVSLGLWVYVLQFNRAESSARFVPRGQIQGLTKSVS